MKTLKPVFFTLLFIVLSINGSFAQAAAPYYDSSSNTIAILLSIIISIIIIDISIVVSYFIIKAAVKNAILEASKALGKDFIKP